MPWQPAEYRLGYRNHALEPIGTFETDQVFAGYRAAGINRLSIGNSRASMPDT